MIIPNLPQALAGPAVPRQPMFRVDKPGDLQEAGLEEPFTLERNDGDLLRDLVLWLWVGATLLSPTSGQPGGGGSSWFVLSPVPCPCQAGSQLTLTLG